MKQSTQWGVQYKDGAVERVKAKEKFYRIKGDPKTDKKAAEAEILFLAAYDERANLVKRTVTKIKYVNGATVKITGVWEQA